MSETETTEAFLNQVEKWLALKERPEGTTFAIWMFPSQWKLLLSLARRGAAIPDERETSLQQLQQEYLAAQGRLARAVCGDPAKGVSFPISTALKESSNAE
jgi:hypothetical protein